MIVGLLVVGLLLGLIVALPFLLDLNRYRDQYLPILESVLQRKVDMGDVRLSLFPTFGLKVRDIQVADDPAFSQTPFLVIPSVEVAVSWKPLLQKKIQVEHVFIHNPQIHVIRTKDGILNVGSIGGVSSRTLAPNHRDEDAEAVNPLLGVLAVENLTLSGGRLTYEDRRHEDASTYAVDKLTLRTESVQWGQTARIQVEGMLQPRQIPFHVQGQAGPLQATWDIPLIDFEGNVGMVNWTARGELTKGSLEMDVQVPRLSTDDVPLGISLPKPVVVTEILGHIQVPLVAQKEGTPTSGIRIHPFKADLHFGNSLVHLVGGGTPSNFLLQGNASTLSTQDLPVAFPLAKPVVLEDLEVHSSIQGTRIKVPSLRAKVFHGVLEGRGEWGTSGHSQVISSQGALRGVAVDMIQAALHPSSFRISGAGHIQWNITGSLEEIPPLKFSGPVNITVNRGNISGVDILRMLGNALKMPGLFGGNPGLTSFSRLEMQAEGSPQGLHIKHAGVGSQDFSVEARGLIDWKQHLTIQGEFLFPQNISQNIIHRYPLAKMAKKEKGISLPFVVKGTAQAPSFQLDTGSLGSQIQQKVNEAFEKMLQGDDKNMQELLNDGKDLLRKFLRP